MRKLLSVVFLFVLGSVVAQEPQQQPVVNANANIYEDVGALYRYEACGGAIIHSNGFGAQYQRGKFLTGYSKGFWEIQFASYKHPKEVKAENPGFDNSKSYFYGKLNSLFILRPGIGYQKVIYTKPRQRGVEVRYTAFGGMSLALLKPVYLIIAKDIPNQSNYAQVTERYDPTIHFTDNIVGRAPFVRGLGEVSAVPGLYARAAFNFEYGMLDDKTRSLETGICVDAYPKKLPVMASERNSQVLVSVYLIFSYGRKWF